ncbi:hypothetical protein LWI28_014200 [Acer negundo]|uniref:Pathogen-related protein n=1 Tax=Acer negundo TaxID=4023 RepID=A0AAD5NVR0_ACENE|nr:hypothetical protein LWI28_014200 [Acer negundo]
MGKRIVSRNGAKCNKVMGDGGLTQDSLARPQDYNPGKFRLFVNGREGLSGQEVIKLGSYNALLKTSLPEEFKYYKAEEETFTSSHEAFRSAFPLGFAWEVLSVYSGPPVIAYKFRHWGFFEGPFKGHAPTGEMVEFYGFGTLKVPLSSITSTFSEIQNLCFLTLRSLLHNVASLRS